MIASFVELNIGQGNRCTIYCPICYFMYRPTIGPYRVSRLIGKPSAAKGGKPGVNGTAPFLPRVGPPPEAQHWDCLFIFRLK